MTKIKMCGLSRIEDIEIVNQIFPEYIGFVFAEKSKRFITFEKAAELKKHLHKNIMAVGIFVNENPKTIANLLDNEIIDIAQLHGKENNYYINNLRKLTDKPIIKAFRIETTQDIIETEKSSADYILLDSENGGTGKTFNWNLIQNLKRPYFLAGGLNTYNVKNAVERLNPYAVDVSSGIETNGIKDKNKMRDFALAVRKLT